MAIKMNSNCIVDLNEIFADFSITLQEFINDIIKQEGYIKYSVERNDVAQAGNFLGSLHEVNITGKAADGEKVTSLFIKKSVTMEKIALADISAMYSRELFIYSKLSKVLSELQDTANVPDEERFEFIRSYDSNNEAIIMENLLKKEFTTYNRTQVVPLRFAELSIIKLAKFHAFSYVLKKKNAKYFEDNIKVMRNLYNLDSDWKGFLKNVCAATIQVVNDEAKVKIKNYIPIILEINQRYILDTVPSNGCLCHGDYKLLNIMVKEVDGVVSEVQPIDYQLVCYGYPVDDFLFFIFSSTDRDFRKKHLIHLKDLYFKTFAKFLSYFDVDVESAYSRQEFEKDYEDRLELGLAFGLYMSAMSFAHFDEGFDVTKLSLSQLPIIPDEMFADRVRGVVEDYIEWGYL